MLWDNGGFDANRVFAAVALPTPPPSAFGPPEAVSPAQEARAGAVVPAAPIGAVWSNRPAGSHPPGGVNAIRRSSRRRRAFPDLRQGGRRVRAD